MRPYPPRLAGGLFELTPLGAHVARGGGLASPRKEMNGLLELFVLEKAVYELKYEVDNRPDWVRIPLNGLMGALERTPEPERAKLRARESRQ